MTETVEFDEFVRTRSARLLQVAYLLTHDHALAEDLLQTVLASCWRGWHRIDGDPEPYVRSAIVNTFNTWWRRRWRGEHPTSQLPDSPNGMVPQHRVDDRDAVWRALLRLPRQQQIVMVLRYFEDLSEAQIAQVMGVSTGAVKGYAAKAIAKLRVDPTVSAVALTPPQVEPEAKERIAAVRERIRHDRRRRVATVAAAVAVVLTLIAGYVVGTRINRSHPQPVHPSPASIEFFDGNHVEGMLPPTPAVALDYSVTWTHKSRFPVTFYVLCIAPPSAPAAIRRYNLVFNGVPWIGDAYCGYGGDVPRDWWTGAETMTWDQNWLGAVNVQPLQESTFGIRFAYQPPAGTTIALMVGDRMPPGEYPLPSRPASVAPLDRPTLRPGLLRIEANDRQGRSLPWGGALGVRAVAQTPGRLRLLIDGVEVGTYDFFDYDSRPKWECIDVSDLVDLDDRPKVNLSNGKRFTVEVVPEGMSGDWYLDFASGAPADRAILPTGGETCGLIEP